MLSLRTAALALVVSALGTIAATNPKLPKMLIRPPTGVSALSSAHGSLAVQHMKRTDVVSVVSSVATTISTKVSDTKSVIENILATDGLSAATVVSDVESAVSELQTVVAGALATVEGLVGEVVTAIEGDSATTVS